MKSLIFIDLYSVPYSFNKPAVGLSQMASIVTIAVVFFISILTLQKEIITRSISSIVYIGYQDTRYKEDSSIQIQLNVSSNFKCNMFYTETGNISNLTYFDYNISLLKNITLSYVENVTSEYEFIFFTKCADKLGLSSLFYEIDITYEATRNNFFDIDNPISKYWSTYSKTVFFKLTGFDKKTPETLPYNQFILNYYYNKIIDDKNYFVNNAITSDKNAKHYLSLNELTRLETIQPVPQNTGTPPFVYYPAANLFTLRLMKNNDICNLTRRNFTLIPQMLAKIVGVFSAMKFGSFVFLHLFSFFSSDFSLLNQVFEYSFHKSVQSEEKSVSRKSKSVYSIVINNEKKQRETLMQETKQGLQEQNYFSFCDNFVFCNPFKTKTKKLRYSLFKRLREWKSKYHEFEYWIIIMNSLKNHFSLDGSFKPKVLINKTDMFFEVIETNIQTVSKEENTVK
jgi:hypothetical protein